MGWVVGWDGSDQNGIRHIKPLDQPSHLLEHPFGIELTVVAGATSWAVTSVPLSLVIHARATICARVLG